MGNYHALSLLVFSLLFSSALSAELCHPDDKKALFRIKKAFNNAYVFASWTPDTDCSDWYIVNVMRGPTVACPSSSQMTVRWRAASTTPPLGAIFLERNQLTGSVPESFGGLKNNKDLYVRLAKNKLSGPLPKSLGAVDFTVIDLSRNQFTGDASFFFRGSKGLQDVDLSRNKFSFNIGEVTLIIFDLSHNKIYGTLPPSLAKLSNLQQFNVSYNRLCGPIPTGGNLDRFDKYRYAHNKRLCGSPLPPCPITNNCQMISIMGNYHALSLLFFSLLFSSGLSAELCHPDDKKALFRIKKAFNNAYEFASWTPDTDCCDWYLVKCDEKTHRIISLSVTDDNKVAGPIPDAVGDLPYLQEIGFINLPKLVGPIPQAIARLKYLQSLWVSHTNITDPIPGFLAH
ncbi:LOW QUALITY PROTEIN: hypothetical protein Cgig2_012138 [Carnegiea gigantea]|uniref:Leucine-rich repeat-containing N-terminal plant-type domain-containing protein n=1 Tax=Carnegiea gigantea TaxID=171969 RepID=A0A9Q1KTA4_9CARY|nr:LOW QUALITY PROTEIN: hypothetical protein Cgig2_012138 [Carnegiea gigantea]